jgi:O-6-methylguanine DNA methyltransferase
LQEPLRYAVEACTDGLVLAARSRRGICAIFLGDDVASLRMQLAQAFPGQVIQEDAKGLATDMQQVINLIGQGNRAGAAARVTATEPAIGTMAVDVGGTAFQQKVWGALCAIPAGETRSYTQLAHDLGLPHAVRAVATACAANILAIAIPCPRVLRSDGSISGYRWGPKRKRALLNRERA